MTRTPGMTAHTRGGSAVRSDSRFDSVTAEATQRPTAAPAAPSQED